MLYCAESVWYELGCQLRAVYLSNVLIGMILLNYDKFANSSNSIQFHDVIVSYNIIPCTTVYKYLLDSFVLSAHLANYIPCMCE